MGQEACTLKVVFIELHILLRLDSLALGDGEHQLDVCKLARGEGSRRQRQDVYRWTRKKKHKYADIYKYVTISINHAVAGWSVLHVAAKKDHLDAEMMLRSNGADSSVEASHRIFGNGVRSGEVNQLVKRIMDQKGESSMKELYH